VRMRWVIWVVQVRSVLRAHRVVTVRASVALVPVGWVPPVETALAAVPVWAVLAAVPVWAVLAVVPVWAVPAARVWAARAVPAAG
jgi:hypothetical protein